MHGRRLLSHLAFDGRCGCSVNHCGGCRPRAARAQLQEGSLSTKLGSVEETLGAPPMRSSPGEVVASLSALGLRPEWICAFVAGSFASLNSHKSEHGQHNTEKPGPPRVSVWPFCVKL